MAATARRLETLDALVVTYGDALLPLQLDVTDKGDDFDAMKRARRPLRRTRPRRQQRWLRSLRMIEELTEEEVRAQLETNFFGALWVTQAALPIMRAQGSGHIIQVSSIGGVGAQHHCCQQNAYPNPGRFLS